MDDSDNVAVAYYGEHTKVVKPWRALDDSDGMIVPLKKRYEYWVVKPWRALDDSDVVDDRSLATILDES